MSLPVVAIVGRPNVGKSSLFNRLSKSKIAVVEDIPGVTRDRIYRKCRIDNKSFILIDTGGFIPDSQNEMESLVEKQIEMAIKEADLLVFLTDIKDGLLPEDERIADNIRKYGKKVILAVNKTDSEKRLNDVSEFYNLAFEDVIPISVMHGRNLDILQETILKNLPDKGGKAESHDIRVSIVGKPNAGKSSIINAILGENRQIVSDIPGTTRDTVDIPIKFHGKTLLFVDTAGIRRKARIEEKLEYYTVIRSIRSIERSDVVVAVIDVSHNLTKQDYRILNLVFEAYKPLIIFMNKSDLLPSDKRDIYMQKLREEMAFLSFASVILGSAKEKKNLVKLQEEIFAVFARSRQSFSAEKLKNILIGPLSEHKHPMVNGRKVFIGRPRQVHTNPIVIQFDSSIPENKIMPSYIRYIDNVLRENLNIKGIPIKYSFKHKGGK